MSALTESILTALWRHGLVAVPLAIAVGLVTALLPCKPGTRHGLWLMLLVWLLVGPWMPTAPRAPIDDQRSKFEDRQAARAAASEQATQGEVRADEAWDAVPVDSERPAELVFPLELIDDLQTLRDARASAEPEPIPTDVSSAHCADNPSAAGVAAQDLPSPVGSVAARPTRIQQVWQLALDGARTWWAALQRYASAVLRLPAPPPAWWLSGLVIVLAARLSATFWLWRRIRRGRPATPEIRALVRRLADEMGLRRVPQVRLVDARLSPMVWVGWGRVLVIPMALWSQLDRDGRMAVIAHELAHLRRRDHWACWIELLATVIYWWHPLAWWIGRRVHEEAECCCDSWVTWVLPRARRAYAEALLATRQFVVANPPIARAAAAGMLTRPARQLARRITMIMTRQEQPRMSWSGSALVAGLAVIGWMAAPAQSNPPVATPVTVDATAPEPPGDPAEVPAPPQQMLYAAMAPANSAPPDLPRVNLDMALARAASEALLSQPIYAVASTVETEPRPDEDDDLDERLRRLEEAVERLARQLEAVRPGGSPDGDKALPPPAPKHGRGADPIAEQLEKTYRVPAGRLQELIELMSLEQVPILIHAEGEGITVRATRAQHEAFERFCGLIGDEEARTYAVPEPQRTKLMNLMQRNDVPIPVASAEGGIVVHGTPAEQAIMRDFISLITGRRQAGRVAEGSTHGQPPTWIDPVHAAKLKAEVEAARKAAETARESGAIEQGRAELIRELEILRQRRNELLEQRRRVDEKRQDLEGVGAGLKQAVERLRALMQERGNADHPELREQIASLEQALASAMAARNALEAQAEIMKAQAVQLRAELEQLSDRAAHDPPAATEAP